MKNIFNDFALTMGYGFLYFENLFKRLLQRGNMPQIPTAEDGVGCLYCGQNHEYANPPGAAQPNLCHICHVCWQLCEHLPVCRWPEKTSTEAKPAIDIPTATPGLTKNARVADLNLKDAFESWIVSSQLFAEKIDPSAAWIEFETFVNEILTAVDKTKRYILMEVGEDEKISGFKFVDASNLFTNQMGEFVRVDGKKRVRLGKDVAVM